QPGLRGGGGRVVASFQQRKSGAFADGNAVARGVVRLGRSRGGQLQRREAVQRRQAQAVRPAHDGGIDAAQRDLARGGGEHLGAGGAGGGNRQCHAFCPQHQTREVG